MRNIWSKIRKFSASSNPAKKPAPRKSRLGVELLENRLTPATMVSLDGSGNLTLEDIIGGSTNDDITIQSDTTNEQFIISDPTNGMDTDIPGATGGGSSTIIVPFDSVSGNAIFVNFFVGDDVLTVDVSLGDFAQTITYDGGTSSGGADALELKGGGTFASVTHTFTSPSAGSVAVTGNGLIAYSGLENVTHDNLAAAERAFVSNDGFETIYVVDLLGAPLMSVDSSHGLGVYFQPSTISMTIDAGAGNDTINIIGVDPTFTASLVINGGKGDDFVDLASDINFSPNQVLDVDLQNDDPSPGVDQIHVAVNTNLVLSGAGSATLKASRNIIMESGSSIVTADGNLTLAANQQAPATSGGAFVGVSVSGATVQSTGSGLVQLSGKGGSTGTNNYGVRVTSGGLVQSGSGLLQVVGAGGASAGSNNAGVFVEGVGAAIRSAGGNIQVTGTGGGIGASSGNNGLLIRSAEIRAGGAGTVAVQGNGGTSSGGPNRGVEMANAIITSSGGDVQVTGTGGAVPGTNGGNFGVYVSVGSQISAGGAGAVTVHGTGSAAGGVNNYGVVVTGDNSRITSSDGDIQVTGTQGAGSGSFAIAVGSSGRVASIGSADIDLIGDSMAFDTTAIIAGGANTVRLRQRTNGTAINLGGADASGVLGLTDAELDRVTAAAIDIGNSNAGTITISASISRAAPTIMNLTTGGNITFGSTGVLTAYPAPATLSAPNGSITTPAGGSPNAPDVAAPNVAVDGIVSPGGASPGEFAVLGNLAFSNTDKYHAQLNGANPNTQYDRISVSGTANLGSAILDVVLGFTPAIGQPFVIVDTAAGVVGVFRDTLGNTLNQGATLNVNGVTFSINYAGGTDGKDVVLTALTSGPSFAIDDFSTAEGNSGAATFTFTVTLSAASSNIVTVNFATANGSATVADGDYSAASGTLTFAPGDTSKQVSVTVNGDIKFESNEIFAVILSNAVNAAISDGQGLGTIVNDDNRPTVSIDDVTESEGTFVTTDFVFTVTLSNPTSETASINWQTFDGSATAGDGDYFPDSDTLTFAPGETTKTITVGINADDKFEQDDSFTVKIFVGSEVIVADDTGVATILNDDAPPTISINDLGDFEGNGGTTNLTFPVLLSNPSYLPITVDFATSDGSATVLDNDYQAASGTLTFTPGQTAKTITILVNGDTKFEPNETLTVNLSASTNAGIADPTALGTIHNDDTAPAISIGDMTKLEGDTGVTGFVFNVSLSNPSAQTVTVDFASANGTALLSDNDYQSAGGTLTFDPNQVSQTVTVLVSGDNKFEPNETFTVNLSGATNASISDGTGLGTIENDDDPPAISINDVAMPEGNVGAADFVFTVSLSNASSETITVEFASANGTATLADNDYQSASGTLAFAPGQTSQTVSVLVNGDTKFEPNEVFAISLSNATNASIADADGVGTIQNDDAQPTISINDVSLLEGNVGSSGLALTVSLSNASSETITVAYATANGSATLADSDFQSTSGTLTFTADQTSQTITVLVNGDTKFEPDETFLVNLSNATMATLLDGQGQGTVLNDDPQPAISINDVTRIEGNSGTAALVFTVSLSNASAQSITVAYATANGSAAAGSDYLAASGGLTFDPGEIVNTVTVLANGDRIGEPNETFFVNLSDATNATIGDGQGIGNIQDDEPRISINNVSLQEGKKGTTQFTFTVTLSTAYDQAVTMSFQTLNGTATSGSDYVARTGTLTFNPGETSKTITIEVKGDNKREADETFFVDLFSNSSNSLFTKNRGIGTILNDD